MNALQWFELLVSCTIQAVVVIAAAGMLERRTSDATTKTRIWAACFVSLVGLAVSGLVMPHWRWGNMWRALAGPDLVMATRVEQAAGRLLAISWGVGAAVLVMRWTWQSWQLRQFLRACPPVSRKQRQRLKSATPTALMHVRRQRVEFRVGPQQIGPFCYQLHRPIVCLPLSLLEGDPGELQHVLLHELTHLQTQHPLQLFTQRLAQATLWFLPAVWSAGRRASLAREFVCDDAASPNGVSAARYLRVLLQFVPCRSELQGAALAGARSASDLKIRARRLAAGRGGPIAQPPMLAPILVVTAAIIASQVWLPTNPLASAHAGFSPWPRWTAAALHALDVPVRDFDDSDAQLQLHNLIEDECDLRPIE